MTNSGVVELVVVLVVVLVEEVRVGWMSECKGEVSWLLLGGVAMLWLCCTVDPSRTVVCVVVVVVGGAEMVVFGIVVA